MSSRLLLLVLSAGLAIGCGGPQETLDLLGEQSQDVQSGAVYALDVSHWTGTIDAADAQCMKNQGVKHLVASVRDPVIMKNQVQVAANAGLTVDAYVYLYWDKDITAQVQAAKSAMAGLPVQRLWLDCEAPRGTLTTAQLVAKIQLAANACGSTPCGIYTRKSWWLSSTGDTKAFSMLPVWYAYYDGQRTFDDWYNPTYWYEGPFGGWAEPTGKQYNDRPHIQCTGVDVVVDHNWMIPGGSAPVPPPAAPTNLAPNGTQVTLGSSVTLSCQGSASAQSYELELWYQASGTWQPEAVYAVSACSQTVTPTKAGAYQWRARAMGAGGAGAWSAYATFTVATTSQGAPTGLLPADGSAIASGSVALSCQAVTGALEYEFNLDYSSAGAWKYYYAYVGSSAQRTVWPTVKDTWYRWKVRARTASGWTAWSASVTFSFGNVSAQLPPAPTPLSPKDDQLITGTAVTLTSSSVTGATTYEFAIEYQGSTGWRTYYTYAGTAAARTFYPTIRNTCYRWKVRAQTSAGFGPQSDWAGFCMGP